MSVDKGMISDADLKLWGNGSNAPPARVQALIAEIERLRAEIKHFKNDGVEYRKEVERLRKVIRDDDEVIDDLRCAGAKLEAEVERLRVDLAVAKAGGEAPGFWAANKPPEAE